MATIRTLPMSQVEEARSDPKFEWSVESVLHIITSTAGQVRWGERLRGFQELRWDRIPAPPCDPVTFCTMHHLRACPRHNYTGVVALVVCLPDTVIPDAKAGSMSLPRAGSRTRRSRTRRRSSCRWCGP